VSPLCFKGIAVGGGDGECGDGERDIDVEYPFDDGVGELPFETQVDGSGEVDPSAGSEVICWPLILIHGI